MLTMLPSELQTKMLSFVHQSDTDTFLTCRLVCQQWNTFCMQILSVKGVKITLYSKRQAKQLLHLLKKRPSFSVAIHHIVVRSESYIMTFIPIICQCLSLQSMDLGASKEFYAKFLTLLSELQNTPRVRDLPKIHEFTFDKNEIYPISVLLICNIIAEEIPIFRHSIKRQHVVLDFIDVPGFHLENHMLKDGLTEMSKLEHITAKYADIFPSDVYFEDIVNSQLQRLKSVELVGIGMSLTVRPMGYIRPAYSVTHLDIVLPCMDVSVLRYIEKALPNLQSISLLYNRRNYFEWMTIIGDNPLQTLSIMQRFSVYCDRISTVIVSIFDVFFAFFVHMHREYGKSIAFVWDLLEQDEEYYVLSKFFD